jgi:DNA polymerase V
MSTTLQSIQTDLFAQHTVNGSYRSMYAIVDCNNFYCSCERLFKPHLDNKPVVVLSNNDGCIISRSDEAKLLGVDMAGPYFMAKPLIKKHDVAVFSSNYNLYGDLSMRVMDTLRAIIGEQHVEVYSVDEAFVDLSMFPTEELDRIARDMKATVEQWTGIKVSVLRQPKYYPSWRIAYQKRIKKNQAG